MKTKYKIVLAIALSIFILSLTLMTRKQVSADINGAEASVISAASSTFFYQGSYYRVKSTYINQLINALDSQYDLTASQASACVSYIYNNISAGISGGYLYEVEVEDTAGEYEDEPDVDTSFEEEAPEASEDDDDTETDTSNIDATNIVNLDEIVTTEKSKEEVIAEATELASDMGVTISFDSSGNGITITDKSGNTLVSMKDAVKNTGFRLNTLVVFPICLIAAVALIIILSWRFGLFSREHTDE